MFNDVLLGEKSSSSRCLHAEDGGELPGLSACLSSGGDVPTAVPSCRWPRCPQSGVTACLALGLAGRWHQEKLCPGLWVGAGGHPPG